MMSKFQWRDKDTVKNRILSLSFNYFYIIFSNYPNVTNFTKEKNSLRTKFNIFLPVNVSLR